MRKERFIDYEQNESMSSVLPFVSFDVVGDQSVIKYPDCPINPYEGVPASVFDLHSVLESGGSLSPSPSVVGSRLDSRDSLESSIIDFNESNKRAVEKQRFDESYVAFEKSLSLV